MLSVCSFDFTVVKDNRFQPNKVGTRAETAKVLALIIQEVDE